MKYIYIILAAMLVATSLVAQDVGVQRVDTDLVTSETIDDYDDDAEEDNTAKIVKYRRSALFLVGIEHKGFDYCGEIIDVFRAMPPQDKFDDHSLNAEYKTFLSNVANAGKKKRRKKDIHLKEIENYFAKNHIARQMVAKWFNRNPETGTFNMDLISKRGHYNATVLDVEMANLSTRGKAMIADAGEELLKNTFVVVNNITYLDKSKQSENAASKLRVAGALSSQLAGPISALIPGASGIMHGISALAHPVADITETIGGFTVEITSYLYRLNWTEKVAATFYRDYWNDQSNPDQSRKAKFDNEKIFKLVYVGKHSSTASSVTIGNSRNEKSIIRKVCTRALDKSIVELQRKYNEFMVSTPISNINENGDIFVHIGLKEGITESSRFEVMEQREDKNGQIVYNKVATIEPVKGHIWDNRYMAAEEAAEFANAGVNNPDKEAASGNVNLTATKFKKISGKKIYQGMLIREKGEKGAWVEN